MPGSTYKIIELRGTSDTSWEEATMNAIKTASKTLGELSYAEVTKFDITIEEGKIVNYRTRLNVAFKIVE